MKRPGVTVAARKGYFAVRDPGGVPVNAWEAPALGALEQKPVPNAFPVRAGAMLFPERGRPGLVPVVVELKTAPLTFQPAADGKTLHVRLHRPGALRRRPEPGRAKGQPALRDAPARSPRSTAQNRARCSSTANPSSRPALYTMETVVHDAPSGKSSVRFSTVEVPKSTPAARCG